jgi:hypothetical protein
MLVLAGASSAECPGDGIWGLGSVVLADHNAPLMFRKRRGMAELSLLATDVGDAEHWRWLLQDDQGNFLADHQVVLDPGDLEYAGFVDLAGFLEERAVPDRRIASEQALVERVGAWIGERVLGRAVGQAVVDASPVEVRVILPAEAAWLMERPLEVAYVNGLPLARQDVSLILQVEGEGEARAPKQPVDRHHSTMTEP